MVLDGPAPGLQAATAKLEAYVRGGGALVALGCPPETDGELAALLGATALPVRGHGEFFAKRASASDLVHRVDEEFAVVDQFQPLVPRKGATTVLAVNWALRDYAVAVEQQLGGGRVFTTSLGGTLQALQTPGLAAMLRRALRSPRGGQAERTFNAAIVGYGPSGGMGYVHGTGITRTEGLHLVAVCDRSEDRRLAAVSEFAGITAFPTADDIARDPDIDLVFIATPPVSHAEITKQMLEAGKHVACEKPMCLSIAEADDLIAAARRNGLALTINQNRRWDPDFLAVQRAVRTGQLGDLFNVETFVGAFEHPCRYWHSDADISGGAAFDWGSHYIDWTLQLMPGLPATVSASAHKRVWHDVTNADQIRVRMQWDDGREAEFTASDVAAIRKPKFYLQGTAGTLEGRYRQLAFEALDPAVGYVRDEPHFAEAPADLTLARYESGYGVTETRLPPQPRIPFGFHRNLADHLLQGDDLAVTPESVRAVIAVLEAAEQSARTGGATIRLNHR